MNLEKIQQLIGYNFSDPLLLKTALVHRSYLNERDRDMEIKEHNERLEFLGDAVLELVITDHLFKNLNETEGQMTSLRSALVNHRTLEIVGGKLELENIILLSKGEREELGKARASIVANAVEAIIGAIYLDSGYKHSQEFIEKHILCYLGDVIENELYKDPKSKLQEYAQKLYKTTPEYHLVSAEGKDHEKVFISGVWLADQQIGEGRGNSKQLAEVAAAEIGIRTLKEAEKNNHE